MQKKQDEKMMSTQVMQENNGIELEDDKLDGVVGGLSLSDYDNLSSSGTAPCPNCEDGILHMIDLYDAECDSCKKIVAINARPAFSMENYVKLF